jgi:hypothetical protein
MNLFRRLRKERVAVPKLTSVEVSLKLPYLFEITGTWAPDEEERKAAWEMYVELVTRVATVELRPHEGLLREALSSLYSLFGTTRAILRAHGPGVAQPKRGGELSFGYLAVAILNGALRPLLARWHPLLEEHESNRPAGVSRLEHERQWEHHALLRHELEEVRQSLLRYADLLAEVSGVQSLVVPVGAPGPANGEQA